MTLPNIFANWKFYALLVLALLTLAVNFRMGAFAIDYATILQSLMGSVEIIQEKVFINIRFPRVVFGVGAGALLAVCGVMLQALFRNPLADPGILGVSSGCSLGAIVYFLWASKVTVFFPNIANIELFLLPILAMIGGMVVLIPLVWMLMQGNLGAQTTTIILMGVAINAAGGALMGLIISIFPNDSELRSITFWTMGSLAGVQNVYLLPLALVLILSFVFAQYYAKDLNLISLGENEATVSGTNVKKLKWIVVILSAFATAITVCFVGFIGFIGLVVPHAMRLWVGSDHRTLIPASMLAGGILLSSADSLSRTVLAPMELPVGIITAMIGTPILIHFLIKMNKGMRLG
jgi:iron complex transport system permease protein